MIIFNKSGETLKNFSFVYDDQSVEQISECKYLGIIFKPSGSFSEAINYLCKIVEVEDEMHFVMSCSKLEDSRKSFFLF